MLICARLEVHYSDVIMSGINHRRFDCLLKKLFRRRSKKTSCFPYKEHTIKLYIQYVFNIYIYLGCCFCFWPPPWGVFVHGLDGLPWTSYLHAILEMVGGGVSGFWGLRDGPLFGSQFKVRVGVLVWSEISYIDCCILPQFAVSCMKLVIFFTLWWPFHIPSTVYTHTPWT